MPKTKDQKIKIVKDAKDNLGRNSTLILADFTGLSANAANSLRKSLKEAGMKFQVIKKRLLKKVLDGRNVALDPKNIKGELGVIFSPKSIAETAQTVYKFEKGNQDRFKMVTGIDLKEAVIWGKEDVTRIGKLPSREVLLGQFVGLLTSPLRSFMFVLNEKSKQK